MPPIDEGKAPLTPPVGSRADAAVQHEASEVPGQGAAERLPVCTCTTTRTSIAVRIGTIEPAR